MKPNTAQLASAPLPPPFHEVFVFHDVDWDFYEQVLRRLENRRVFVTYCKGLLEVMAPSFRHIDISRLLALLIHILAEEFDVPLRGAGSTTLQRKDLEVALEPDRCFYIENVARILGNETLDLSTDPPPDLAVEVEISQRLIDRVEVYAALGVPELWRHDGERLGVYQLDKNRHYVEANDSRSFPMIQIAQIGALLQEFHGRDDIEWAAHVREWIRAHLKGG